MWRALQLHVLSLTSLVASSVWIVWALGDDLPPLRRHLILGLCAGYAAAWLFLLGLRVAQRRSRARRAWRTHDRAIMWLGNLAVITGFWLGMPYADDAMLLLVVFLAFGVVIVEALGTVERPPKIGAPSPLPLAIPVAVAVYFVVHWDRYSPVLVPYSLAYGYVALALRGLVQRAVDRAYAATLQVASERDARTRFLESASHDLGQPLQAARLFFDDVLESRTRSEREAAGRRVTWALDAAEQLLRRMLDHLRLEAGAVTPRLSDVALGSLIARVAELNEPAARLAGVDIIALTTRLAVRADPDLAERALGNLVANAIRHAKARRLLVGARRRAGRVRLWVIDDGAGVAPADAPRLFDDYAQGSDHGDQIRGGFGLGLASARRMANLMDGAVGLEPRWTRGAAFWLELPAADAKAA
jgi:signal transduction histidine kinase